MHSIKWIVFAGIVAGASLGGLKQARADECLEVGLRDRAGEWGYYRAWIDEENGNHVKLHYDYHHGILEMKVFEKEKGDGEDVIVMKGRWYEGRDQQRSGKIRLEMEKGHHHARGWYAFGDGEDSPHLDFELRDCKRRH